MKAAASQTAATRFRKTGIFPTNIYIFLSHEFAAADPADMPVDDPKQEVNLINGKVVDGVQQAGPPMGYIKSDLQMDHSKSLLQLGFLH